MRGFDELVERKLAEAIERGDFDDLPGAGRPLPPDALADVPDELRSAYRLLRNAGCVPPELEARKHLVSLRDLLAACEGTEREPAVRAELDAALLRYETLLERSGRTPAHQQYDAAVRARLGGARTRAEGAN